MNDWRTDEHYPGLLLVIAEKDFSRVGNCWMKGRLKVGDLILCMKHAGDCFWKYAIVENHFTLASTGRQGYLLVAASAFGAYTLGTPYEFQPTTREFHLLMAGETISLDSQADWATGVIGEVQ